MIAREIVERRQNKKENKKILFLNQFFYPQSKNFAIPDVPFFFTKRR